MKNEDILLLVIIVAGIIVLTVPSFIGTKTVSSESQYIPWYAYLGIVYVPLGLSFTNVIMRKMKGLHFVQVSVFKLFISIPMAVIYLLATRPSYQALENFEVLDWVYLVILTIV